MHFLVNRGGLGAAIGVGGGVQCASRGPKGTNSTPGGDTANLPFLQSTTGELASCLPRRRPDMTTLTPQERVARGQAPVKAEFVRETARVEVVAVTGSGAPGDDGSQAPATKKSKNQIRKARGVGVWAGGDGMHWRLGLPRCAAQGGRAGQKLVRRRSQCASSLHSYLHSWCAQTTRIWLRTATAFFCPPPWTA